MASDEMKLRIKTEFDGLQPNAKEVLGQLFLYGPTYDGHVASKAGRDALRELAGDGSHLN